MATVNFPEYLNTPEQSGFSRVRSEGFVTSDPASGPAFYVIETEDLPVFFDVSFQFEPSRAQAFEAWMRINNDVLFGEQFNMQVYNPNGYAMQEVRFVEGGTPQLTGVNADTHFYSARIEVRKEIIDTSNDELLVGLPELGSSDQLQIIVNNMMPEV